MDGLDDGQYTLFFETTTSPQIRSSVNFDWPIVSEETSEEEVVNFLWCTQQQIMVN